MNDDTPPLEPRTGDYAEMLDRAGRRRRVRRLRGLAAAAPVALAVALAAVPQGNNATSLRPATEPAGLTEEPEPTREPEPGTSASPEPTPSPSPSGEPTAEPSEEPGGSGEPEPSEGPDGSPKPTPHPSAEPSPRKPRPSPPDEPAAYVYVVGEAPANCHTTGGAKSAPDTQNWCAGYAGEQTLANGQAEALPFRLCRSSLSSAGTLTRYGSSWLKARAVAAADGDVPWAWHAGTSPAVPAIRVEPGDCVQWTITWRVDVPAGQYDLHPVFIVDEYQVRAEANRFPVTVTG